MPALPGNSGSQPAVAVELVPACHAGRRSAQPGGRSGAPSRFLAPKAPPGTSGSRRPRRGVEAARAHERRCSAKEARTPPRALLSERWRLRSRIRPAPSSANRNGDFSASPTAATDPGGRTPRSLVNVICPRSGTRSMPLPGNLDAGALASRQTAAGRPVPPWQHSRSLDARTAPERGTWTGRRSRFIRSAIPLGDVRARRAPTRAASR
jgi:hypothetical protein